MKICVCDRCHKEIDEYNCEEVKYDSDDPLQLCDDCYAEFASIMYAWLRPEEYNIKFSNKDGQEWNTSKDFQPVIKKQEYSSVINRALKKIRMCVEDSDE